MKKAAPFHPIFADRGKVIAQGLSIYRALLHPLRLQIIGLVAKRGEVHVSSIVQELKLPQPLVSAQLKILRGANFLKARKTGRLVFYSVNRHQINHISEVSANLVGGIGSISNALHPPGGTALKGGAQVTFTSTEYAIIRMICQEKTSEEMARKLKLSKRTIEDYRTNLIRKMKVRNSVGILLYAVKHGIIELQNT
jgi:DNA-binding CsgD family transcriptional regulator/DNA-binding transcriptional ArsR family regulator